MEEIDRWAAAVILVSVGLVVTGTLFVERYPVSLVLQLQLLRGLYLLIIVSMIYLAWALWAASQSFRKAWLRRCAASGLIAMALWSMVPKLGRLGEARGMHHVNLPGQLPRNDWIDVGRWCRLHTPSDAAILVPPLEQEGFRIHSQRSIVGDWKDGAPSVFSERYAKTWWERMEDLKEYDSLDEAQFCRLKKKYGATFAVSRRRQRLDLGILYRNRSFVVYEMSESCAAY